MNDAMNEKRVEGQPTRRGSPENGEPGLVAFASIVWRYSTLIVSLFAVTVGVSVGVTLVLPKTYESTATILAPREGGGSAVLGGLAAMALVQQVPIVSTPSLTPNRDILLSVLKSRTVTEAAAEAFHLRQRYRVRYKEDAIAALKARTEISVSREGVISVRVEDTDPVVAAQIANFLVAELDRLVSQYGVGEAGRQRAFITVQLARAKNDLETAEEALRRFQERNQAVVLQEQTRGAIEGAARLKGEIMAAEVQMQVIRSFATDANPDIIAIRRRIDEMKRQLGQMQYGDDNASVSRPSPPGSSDGREIYVPFARVPGVGLELARLTRDVKVQETLVSLLTQQLEQAKIAEAKDLPVVQIMDRAVPAERHSWPKLRLNVAIAVIVSLLVSVFLVFFVDYIRNLARRARTV